MSIISEYGLSHAIIRSQAMLAGYYGAASSKGPGAPTASPALIASQPAHSGLANKPAPPPQPQSATSHQPVAMPPVPPIDSPAFIPDVHIPQILKTYPMEKLLTEHRNMARDIKNLDSDMQQLVYENYNKFISATDTIRSMKSNMDSMSSDMYKLKSVMDNVSNQTSGLCDKLQKRRETMEELQKVQGLVKKLQAVFDLPKKMKAALEGDMVETAVSFYAEALPLLHKYGGAASGLKGSSTFRQIALESEGVAREIKTLLRKRLTEKKDSEESCVLLLRKMGEPDDTLQDKYLQGRAGRLRKILREASVVVDAMAVSASNLSNANAAAAATGIPPTPLSVFTIPIDALLSRGVDNPAIWGFNAPPQQTLTPTPPDGLPATNAAATAAIREAVITSPTAVHSNLIAQSAAANSASSTSSSSAAAKQIVLLSPPTLRQFVRLLDEKVINAMQETVVNVLKFFLQGDAQSPVKRRPLVSLSREVFGEYFKIVKRALSDHIATSVHNAAKIGEAIAKASAPPSTPLAQTSPPTLVIGGSPPAPPVPPAGSSCAPIYSSLSPNGSSFHPMEIDEDWGAEILIQALSSISADLSLLHSHLPELSLKDKSSALVSGCIDRHLTSCFEAVIERLFGGIVEVRIRLQSNSEGAGAGAGGGGGGGGKEGEGGGAGGGGGGLLRRGYLYCTEALQRNLTTLVTFGLKPYDSTPSIRLMGSWRDEYVTLVQSRVQGLFLTSLQAFLDEVGLRFDGSDLLITALKNLDPSTASSSFSSSLSSSLHVNDLSSSAAAADKGHRPQGSEASPPNPLTPSTPANQEFRNSKALELYGAKSSSLWRLHPTPIHTHTTPPSPLPLPATTATTAAAIATATATATAAAPIVYSSKPGMALLLAKICGHMEQKMVTWVMEALAKSGTLSAPGAIAAGPGGGQGAIAKGAGLPALSAPAFIPGDVARRLNAASQALLVSFVEGHGRQVSMMIRRSVASTNWLNHKEPRAPRPICDLCIERIGKAEADVLQLVEEVGAGRVAVGGRGGGGGGGIEESNDPNTIGGGDSVERNLAKIFAGAASSSHHRIFSNASILLTQSSLLSTVSSIGLKTFIECIRLQALGRAGLQQLQLDCRYLSGPLKKLAGGAGSSNAQAIEGLLNEVVGAGLERCFEPTLLEQPVLDRILAAMEN